MHDDDRVAAERRQLGWRVRLRRQHRLRELDDGAPEIDINRREGGEHVLR